MSVIRDSKVHRSLRCKRIHVTILGTNAHPTTVEREIDRETHKRDAHPVATVGRSWSLYGCANMGGSGVHQFGDHGKDFEDSQFNQIYFINLYSGKRASLDLKATCTLQIHVY